MGCLKKTAYLLAVVTLSLGCNAGPEQEAAAIHERILTVDTHVDTPFLLSLSRDIDLGALNDRDETGSQVDFPRMKDGGLDAVFFAVFVSQGDRTAQGYDRARRKALTQFDIIHEQLMHNPSLAEPARFPDDAYRLEREGKRAVFIGMENGYPLGSDLSMLEEYFDLGARYITLTHIRNNDIGDSSTDENGPEHGGLSKFGRAVVTEMNRLGMLVDVSHVSDETFYDVLALTRAPVIASHSGARAVCNHPRNLDDSMLEALDENGGVIHVTLFPEYINEGSEREGALPRIADVVDHIDHIVGVTGIDNVGIGTDFDGGGMVADCTHVGEIGTITLELVKRGYSEEEIEKIWSGNFMRVFKAAAAYAEQISSETLARYEKMPR